MKNLDQELIEKLQVIANNENALIMSFIAPETVVKTSPVDYDYASITVQDMYTIEETIEKLQTEKNFPQKLHLIIHTPGGSVFATTKIAKYLQGLFKEIEAYVPYEASSGGTMLCLAANLIVMDKLSNLTPIDPQTPYKGQYVSSASFDQAVKELLDMYGNNKPSQIPTPYQQLCEKIDPIILKEMNKTVMDTGLVAWELLKKSQIKKSGNNDEERDAKSSQLMRIASDLARPFWPHSHIIDIDEAIEIGLNIYIKASSDKKDNKVDKLNLLKTYKKWVSQRLKEPQTSHIIEYFIPKIDEKVEKAS